MTVGYAYVVADIFHIGHLQYLMFCRSLCDTLIVGVLTDKATMEKKQKPVVPFYDRLKIIECIKYVDSVVSQNTYSPMDNIKDIRPDILFESASHDFKELEKHEKLIESLGGRMVVSPYYTQQNSSRIKELIRNE